MKDFKHWGLKMRLDSQNNYKALWHNLKTVRLGEGKSQTLPITTKEFYDVGITTKCNACCDFCYVSANNTGEHFSNICDTWKKWMDMYWEKQEGNVLITNKAFQIAIGSTGEATIHPEFCEFLKTVYETNVVPNYTTNGLILSAWNDPTSKDYELANQILEYTSKYVGGVAISYGNKSIRDKAEWAIKGLLEKGNTNINIHHLISTKESVDEFVKEWLKWEDKILYHVLLPLMPSGRSTKSIQEGVFEYLEEVIEKNNIKNVAFGANFIKNLESSKIKTWLYDEHSLSANVLLKPNEVILTKSSFDLNPIKTINL